MPSRFYGLHERLRTAALLKELEAAGLEAQVRWKASLEADEVGPALAAHLAQVFGELSRALRDSDRAAWKGAIRDLEGALSSAGEPLTSLPRQLPELPFQQLLEVVRPEAGVVRVRETVRPDLPLGVSALLTGSARTPSLVSQLEKELQSADRVDWLVSFIKWSGIRALRDALRRFTEAPSDDGSPRLRVATTSYLGATDAKAVRFLAELDNTEVKVSEDVRRTRLHAKAYIFHRETGFGSAYVGSANVSHAALTAGLEWTAKISEYELPYLWRNIEGAFETHWEDDKEFVRLKPSEIDAFEEALRRERHGTEPGGVVTPGVFFDLAPYPFQEVILQDIQSERRAGENRHLVIAATGTGKTMVAAFDYKSFALERARDGTGPAAEGSRPSLLFLAHRQEILKQALESYRHVLKDRTFGDLLVGGAEPRQPRHLFASVASWHSRGLDELAPDHFDYVVLDEAHHAAAKTYQAILDHVRPKVLLGLTATPERADGRDIRSDFGDRFTHELRLPDAIERQLLVPFHYFGVTDHESVDLSNLQWRRGGYATEELDRVFGANDARARWVRQQVQEYATDEEQIRGLGFCVSQAHARFMAARFTEWSLPSVALTAETPQQERGRVQGDLVSGRLRFIFTVDLYNEGVDIPEVDTVLLLRPTESLTVYLQQIGRGLREHDGKTHLTVLDFIAPQHRRFRFVDRFRALTSDPSRRIDRQVKEGFPWLPSGCLIRLEPTAQEVVLQNIRETLGMHRPQVIQALERLRQETEGRPAIREMVEWLHFDGPDDVLKHGLPCRLLADAGGEPRCTAVEPYESGLHRGLRALAACDDRGMLEALRVGLLDKEAIEGARRGDDGLPSLSDDDRARLELAYSLLWGVERPGAGKFADVHRFVLATDGLRDDIVDLVDDRLARLHPASGVHFPDKTGMLELHAHYTREQILLSLGKGSFDTPPYHREGVAFAEDRKVDAFFVTIRKSKERFSPTTMYEDYAVSERLFHWQSQSLTSEDSPTGQRYIHHRRMGCTPMLFVREAPKLENGLTAPFCLLGPLQYVKHEGSRPMSITWRLVQPMPVRVYRWAREVA
jgi:superfamily II DNA or RNA helicase/HKD family nuclease